MVKVPPEMVLPSLLTLAFKVSVAPAADALSVNSPAGLTEPNTSKPPTTQDVIASERPIFPVTVPAVVVKNPPIGPNVPSLKL